MARWTRFDELIPHFESGRASLGHLPGFCGASRRLLGQQRSTQILVMGTVYHLGAGKMKFEIQGGARAFSPAHFLHQRAKGLPVRTATFLGS